MRNFDDIFDSLRLLKGLNKPFKFGHRLAPSMRQIRRIAAVAVECAEHLSHEAGDMPHSADGPCIVDMRRAKNTKRAAHLARNAIVTQDHAHLTEFAPAP